MSVLHSGATTVQQIVLIIKAFQEEERALNAEFTDRLAQSVNNLCGHLGQLQAKGSDAEKVKDTVELLMMFLDSKAKMYSSTICSQIS